MNWSLPNKLLTRGTGAAAALLLWINVYICRELFRIEYLRRMESIEGAYIGISRYILKHPFDLNWFPLWYGGIPFQNTYPPVLHLMVAGVAWLFRISPALAHHAVSASFYCLGPVALMFLGYALSGNLKLSFVAGLMFSLLSPSAILMRSVRADVGGLWNARRLNTLIAYGEGPHVTSITLLLLAILALHLAIERGGPWRTLVASIAIAAAVLTNWLGAFALAIGCICYLLARPIARSTMLHFAGIAALAYALAAPWIPPSTILAIQRNAQFTVGSYPMGVKQIGYAAWLLLAMVALFWILKISRATLAVRFAALFLVAVGALPLTYEWFHVFLMPQPDRYHSEMEIGVCLFLTFAVGHWALKMPRGLQVAFVVVLVVGGVWQTRTYRKYFRKITQAIEIEKTVEYEVAQWLDKNLPGQRVFVQGSTRFWMNAFADNPQTGGGFDQGIINPVIPALQFGVPYLAGDGPNVAMFLRVFGAHAVVVSGPKTRDSYRDWRDAEKFRGVLPEIWRDGDDAIYGVPGVSGSLAHLIRAEDVVARAPVNVEDVEAVRGLNAALLSEVGGAELRWLDGGSAVIRGTVRAGDVVIVQASYHSGWRASVGGVARTIRRDGLGFMVIEPGCVGECEIRLSYDGGWEMSVAKWIRGLGILGWLGWWFWWRGRTPYGWCLSGGLGDQTK